MTGAAYISRTRSGTFLYVYDNRMPEPMQFSDTATPDQVLTLARQQLGEPAAIATTAFPVRQDLFNFRIQL
jgi:hypothetical protein